MLRYFDTFSGIGTFTHAIEQVLGDQAECVGYSEIDPYAIRIYNRHFPTHRNFGNIAAINTDDLPDFDLMTAGFPCFPKGTLILTEAGLKDISDVEVGDFVLTHQNRWRRVYRTMCQEAPTIRLKGHGCPKIVTTHDHPFWAVSSRRVWNNTRKSTDRIFTNPDWLPAKDMAGNYWTSPCKFPESDIPQMRKDRGERSRIPAFTSDFFVFVGYWLGNGWLNLEQRSSRPQGQTNGKTIVCCDKSKKEIIATVLERANVKYTYNDERTSARFTISSKPLARWIYENFRRYAHGKTVPSWLLGQKESIRRSFLEGYLMADGDNTVTGKRRANSVSYKLICGIKLLSQSLEYSVSVHDCSRKRELFIEGRRVKERQQWVIILQKKMNIATRINDHIFSLCRQTEDTGTSQTVYNLSIEEDESYTADTLVVHNCTDLSIGNVANLGLDGARSGLIYEAMRILKAKSPRYFLVENVASMKQKNTDAISTLLGVEPVLLEAAEVSPQKRTRLFWANFPIPPLDPVKGIAFQDVLLPDPSASLDLSARELAYMNRKVAGGRNHWDFAHHHDSLKPRSQCLTANLHKGVPYNVLVDHRFQVTRADGTTGPRIRKLHAVEAERLMGVPDGFTELDAEGKLLSNSRRYRALGNGVSEPVIEHIIRALQHHMSLARCH